MRFVAAVMAVAALAGCAACGEVECDAACRPNFYELDSDGPPPRADEAVSIALESLTQRSGLGVAPEIAVHWVSELLPVDDGFALGVARGCELWLLWRSGTPLPAMLVAHEVGHCVRRTLVGDGDGEHADAVWWGDGGLVDQARLDMFNLGF